MASERIPDQPSPSEERKAPARGAANLSHPKYYLNREISMIDFQVRVLEEARDKSNPLLERVKFLAIVGSNMDAFYMVRVGGLTLQKQAGVTRRSIDGLTPAEQLAAIRKASMRLMKDARKLWDEELMPDLDNEGIHILDFATLSEKQHQQVNDYFLDNVFPVLTPLAFDQGHPFPHISNMSLNLAVLIEDQKGEQHFARVKVPHSLPRLVPIKRSSGGEKKDGTVAKNHYFVWLEQLIAHNLHYLFPGMRVLAQYPFRVLRHADYAKSDFESDDLLEFMEESVRQRRFGSVVHLAVQEDMPPNVERILVSNLKIDENQVYRLSKPLGMSSLMELHGIDLFDLKYPSFKPHMPLALEQENSSEAIFAAIRERDILVHYPYDSFVGFTNYLEAAARDPNVLAIKQTLYRVGKDSPVVRTLLKARRDYGKQVAVLVELKARFDEENNIEWAKKLEAEGVHVTYGLNNLKTHSKMNLVIRQEGDHIRRYVNMSTGNFNHHTARLYEDVALFTADYRIGADATDFFNLLTGYSAQTEFRELLVAPVNLRERLNELIEREIEIVRRGGEGRLIFKMNSLVDKKMIRNLYKASQAGVEIDLIVRGMCCLRPGVEGVSENIRVVSILGRYLEHSRIYYFHNGGEAEIYIGSADMMNRNLDERVEVVFPVREAENFARIRDEILGTYLQDNVKARLMQADGAYTRMEGGDEAAIHAQERLMQLSGER